MKLNAAVALWLVALLLSSARFPSAAGALGMEPEFWPATICRDSIAP